MKSYEGYSNRNQNNLESGKITNPHELRLQILKRQGNRVIGDCLINIKSPTTFNQIKTPIRNAKCNSPECIFDLDETIQELKVQVRKDKDELVYFCANCINVNASNKRLVKDLYFDRQAMTLMHIAKSKYQDKIHNDGPRFEKFKNGALVFRKCGEDSPSCTYELTFKQKNRKPDDKQKVVEHKFVIPLQIGQKANNNETIKFKMNDKVSVQGLKSSYQKVIKQQSKLLKQVKSFASSCSKISASDLEKNAIEYLGKVVQNNTKLQQVQNDSFYTQDYTFTFSNRSYLQPQNSCFSVLNVFFPRLRLWRQFRLQYQNKKSYAHPQGAVFIKNGYKIYVIGGYRVKFPHQERPKDPKQKSKIEQIRRQKILEMTRQMIEIDLSIAIKDILQPTRQVQNDTKPTLLKITKKNTKPIIDKLYKNSIPVKSLCLLPDYLCNSAGEIVDKQIYLFGGCTVSKNQALFNENIVERSYCYHIGNNSWKQIQRLPNPRAYHSVIRSKNLLYIVGGSQQKKDNGMNRCNDQSLKKMDIFNVDTKKYSSEQFKVNSLLSVQNCNDGFKSRALAIRYPLNTNQFIFITGDKHGCYSLNTDTKMFSFGGSQAEFSTLVKQQKALDIDSNRCGPKIQQIFDYNPPFIDGCYYYGVHSLAQRKSYVIYGIKQDWSFSQEFDMGAQFKK